MPSPASRGGPVGLRPTGGRRELGAAPLGDAPLLQLDALQVGHGGPALLPPLSVAVRPRQVWALVGRNGSGKTTLLRTVLGFAPPLGGAVRAGAGARLGWVPQRGEVDPALPARAIDVVRGGVDRGWSFLDPLAVRRAEPEVRAALAGARAADLAHARFSDLSEGQKQRVLTARALASSPDLLLCDEPTSAMDPTAENAVFEMLAALCRERGVAVILASHRMAVIPAIATHAIFVDREEFVCVSGSLDGVVGSEPFRRHYGAALGELSARERLYPAPPGGGAASEVRP